MHGAYLTLVDGLGLGVGLPPSAAAGLRATCAQFLRQQLPPDFQPHADMAEGRLEAQNGPQAHSKEAAPSWGIHPFYVPKPSTSSSAADGGNSQGGKSARATPGNAFELTAPTAARNAFRVLRALSLPKAVLLEGSPGVGKTALVAALAKRAGVPLVSGSSQDCGNHEV